jgi:hypothetical protein
MKKDDGQEGYSTLFYIMLVIGIVGIVGFLMVAANSGFGG